MGKAGGCHIGKRRGGGRGRRGERKRVARRVAVASVRHEVGNKDTDAAWVAASAWCKAACHAKSMSTNGANRPTQGPCVRNVHSWDWLSKRKAKTKKVTSQCFARLGALYGWASFVAGHLPKSARQRVSMDGTWSRDCLSAAGHAFHW